MATFSPINPLNSLYLAAESIRATNITIIFDLCTVFLRGNGALNTDGAYALRLIDPAKTARLLYDCSLQGHRLFAFSNWSKSLYSLIRCEPLTARILSYFDDVILGAEMGLKTCDERIFKHLMAKHNLDPRLCIIVNDKDNTLQKSSLYTHTAKKIVCAKASITNIREALEQHGIL